MFFYRKEMGGDLAHVALAVQGAPAGSPQSLALAVASKGIYSKIAIENYIATKKHI